MLALTSRLCQLVHLMLSAPPVDEDVFHLANVHASGLSTPPNRTQYRGVLVAIRQEAQNEGQSSVYFLQLQAVPGLASLEGPGPGISQLPVSTGTPDTLWVVVGFALNYLR